ncbi:hypothetical protein [Actinomadura algeriensis]|uniref:Uncharacterized protein n=1 Tax=Actinomadura algeriensis TaxID=1679523 RepID=A0ABR9JQG5_9ACTN|nr:hypothetical protein [Actinomadura algeriensis]MBE1532638.1 hypothetical protein [Actinomadura algeriensis]
MGGVVEPSAALTALASGLAHELAAVHASRGHASGVPHHVLVPSSVILTEDGTIRWDIVEQIALVGEGKDAELVVWYAGDDRPVDGPERHGGTVVCRADDVVAPEHFPHLRAALARFAGARYVD